MVGLFVPTNNLKHAFEKALCGKGFFLIIAILEEGKYKERREKIEEFV